MDTILSCSLADSVEVFLGLIGLAAVIVAIGYASK